jgi:hypothetical protein
MEATSFSETLVFIYQSAGCHMPEVGAFNVFKFYATNRNLKKRIKKQYNNTSETKIWVAS